MEEKIAIRVNQVSKMYRLWRTRRERLSFLKKRSLQILSSKLKKEKPDSLNNYREFYALNDVSLTIRQGESWGIIGVNGSGKSTLLKIISGNLRPSMGRVEVDGKVAILDYGSGFNGDFTGKENIFIKASLLGLTKKQIGERYESIVEFADIGDFINQPVSTYSSGMSARLGFAIMAHVDADIIITDEALAVGDIFFVQKCMRFIRSFLEKGTFLFVSHSLNDVLSLCQNAVWLEKGSVKAIGSAAAVTNAYLAEESRNTQHSRLLATGENNVTPAQEDAAEITQAEINIEQPFLAELMEYQTNFPLKDVQEDCRYNMIDISPFSAKEPCTGADSTTILDAALYDEAGTRLSCVQGGEIIRFTIKILAPCDLQSPIIGFQVMNGAGQVIFADNSYWLTQMQPVLIKAGTIFVAEFRFQMPFLPVGDYAIRVAVAIGEEEGNAIFLQSIDNALNFRSVYSSIKEGLIGIPSCSIEIQWMK